MSALNNEHPAVTFLQFAHPHDLWLINAFPVDRTSLHKPDGATFQAGEEDELVAFLEKYEGGSHNVYFSVNPPVGRMSKKALRTDIERMAYLHVDLDPKDYVGDDATPAELEAHNEAERARLLALLTTNLPEGVPKPTAVVDSGGGYWGFWRLDEGFPIEGSETRYEEAKLWNLQLELLFGADACHNVDRIARMPGAVNYPDARKLAKGRVARTASIIEMNDVSYPLDSFTKSPQLQSPTAGFSAGHTVEISENVQRVMDLDQELPASVPSWCKVVISKGHDPDDPSRFAKGGVGEIDRSDALFYTVCELVRNQVPDDQIYAIITDPDWDISESVIDGSNGRGDRYAKRQIERAHEFAVDPMLAELNNQFAVVQDAGNGRCKVVYADADTGHLVRQAPSDFRTFYSNQFVEVPTQNGARQVPLGKWWFEHKLRRSFRSIAFLPGQEVGTDVYNLWRGFAFEAVPGGSCELYLDHVRQVICRGNEAHYEYLIKWMASAVQNPGEPGHIAVVLRGKGGTGKGVFAKHFGGLFGRHYVQIANGKNFVGFNSMVEQASVVFLDEAVVPNNEHHKAVLKSMVTEDYVTIEPKGINSFNVPNVLHVIMASNDDHTIQAANGERRYLALEVGEDKIKDFGYFAQIAKQMKEGGYSALLHQLQTMDLSGFEVRDVPMTEELMSQIENSMDPLPLWALGVLESGQMPHHVNDKNGKPVPNRAWLTGELVDEVRQGNGLLDHARQSHSQLKNLSHIRLGRYLRDVLGVESPEHEAGGKKHSYIFPPLAHMRRAWCEKNGARDWPGGYDCDWTVESCLPF